MADRSVTRVANTEDPPAAGATRRVPQETYAEAQGNARSLRLRALLLCVYSSLWGMGGHLSGDAARTACSDFIRQVMHVFSDYVRTFRALYVRIVRTCSYDNIFSPLVHQ